MLAILLAAMGSSLWSPAQEEIPTPPKKPVSKAEHDAKARAVAMKRQAKAKADAEAKAKALDINSATKEQLRTLPGITEAYAEAIIAKRPYHSKAELVTKRAIPEGTFQTIRKRVAAK
jgi:DNA uptake protein ComE-like DNA-binding protein